MTEQDPTRPPDESPGGDEGEFKDSFISPTEDDELKDSAIHEPDPIPGAEDDELKESFIQEPDPPLHAHDDEPGGG